MKNNESKQHKLFTNLVKMLNEDLPGINFERMMAKHMTNTNSGFKPQKHPFSQPAQRPSNNPIKNNKA